MLIKDIIPRNLVLGQIFDDFSLATKKVNYDQEDLCSYITNDTNNYYWLNIESVWGPMGFVWDAYNNNGYFSKSNKNYMVLPKVPDGERIKNLNKLIPTIPCTNSSIDNMFKILKSNWSNLENLESIFMSIRNSGNNNMATYVDADFTDSLSEQNDTTSISTIDQGLFANINLKYNGCIIPPTFQNYGSSTIIFDNENIDKLFLGTKNNEGIKLAVTNIVIIWNVSDVFDIRRITKNIELWVDASSRGIIITNNSNKNFILKNLENSNKLNSYNITNNNYKKEDIINITFIPNNNGLVNDLILKNSGERPFTLNLTYDENTTQCYLYKCLCDIYNWDDWDNSIIQKMKHSNYNYNHANKLFHLSTIYATEKNNNIVDLTGVNIKSYITISNTVPSDTYYEKYNNKPVTEIKLYNDIMPKIICDTYSITYNGLNYQNYITLDIDINNTQNHYFNYEYFKNPITIKEIKQHVLIIKLEEVQQYKLNIHITKNCNDNYMHSSIALKILNKTKDYPSNMHIKCVNTIIDDDVNLDDLKITHITYINWPGAIIDHPIYLIRYNVSMSPINLNTIATDYRMIKNISLNINRDMELDEIDNFVSAFYPGNGTITIISSTYQKFTAEQIDSIVSKGYEIIEQIN